MIETGRVTAKSGLRLREQAEITSPVVATVPFDTVITIDHREGNWLKVQYHFKSGYLYKDYVDVLKIPGGPPMITSWKATILALVIAIVTAVMALAYGSMGWRP